MSFHVNPDPRPILRSLVVVELEMHAVDLPGRSAAEARAYLAGVTVPQLKAVLQWLEEEAGGRRGGAGTPSETIPRDKLGISLGLFAAGLPVGTGVSFNLLRLVAESTGWKGALAGALVVLASTLLLFELTAGRHSVSSGLSVNPARALRSAELWRLSGITVLGYAAILGFTTWAPTTLVGLAGIPIWGASLIASLLLVIDIPFAPLWGAFSDRVGRRRPFVILAFAVYLLGSLTVPFLAQTHSVAALVLTIGGMGIGCAMFFPAALTIPAETVTPDRAGAAYGLFFTAQVAGMLVGPMTIGQILDAATPLLAFLGVSAITAGGLALAFTLRSR